MASRTFFLVVFDPRGEKLVRMETFTDPDEAANARRAAEDEYRGAETQVVMFAARSLDSVKKTHPHYFKGPSSGDTMEFAALA